MTTRWAAAGRGAGSIDAIGAGSSSIVRIGAATFAAAAAASASASASASVTSSISSGAASIFTGAGAGVIAGISAAAASIARASIGATSLGGASMRLRFLSTPRRGIARIGGGGRGIRCVGGSPSAEASSASVRRTSPDGGTTASGSISISISIWMSIWMSRIGAVSSVVATTSGAITIGAGAASRSSIGADRSALRVVARSPRRRGIKSSASRSPSSRRSCTDQRCEAPIHAASTALSRASSPGRAVFSGSGGNASARPVAPSARVRKT